MLLDKFKDILSQFGRGILIGLGIGAALLGLVVLLITWKNQQPLNLGALLALFSGSFCILLGLNLSKKQVESS
ncbi:hypothetical protein AB4259_21745 [Vibrio amylolyticus]|uniref:hypothetical protein n=1 Tax=Vibrio amylolyticus TaxID=2847292 RepID=UPI003550FD8B